MKKSRIGIVDYGSANIASVYQKLSKIGYTCSIVKCSEDLNRISLLVLPGVGAFPAAMSTLENRNLIMAIKSWAEKGHPLLGICLGMQLLAESSYEQGNTKGLGILPGIIRPIKTPSCTNMHSPGWHIGWNTLEETRKTPKFLHKCFTSEYYFNHAYEFNIDEKYVLATSFLQSPIVSMVGSENIIGIQPHPEKSQYAGMLLLKTLLEEMLHA